MAAAVAASPTAVAANTSVSSNLSKKPTSSSLPLHPSKPLAKPLSLTAHKLAVRNSIAASSRDPNFEPLPSEDNPIKNPLAAAFKNPNFEPLKGKSPASDGTSDVDFSLDKPREECGVVGIYGDTEASRLCYLALHALQHRGQEGAGIVAVHDNVLQSIT
ncbi:hypothetical protein CRG98_025973, partial [Punica granatum]